MDARNATASDRLEGNDGPEGDLGEDGELVGRVSAVNSVFIGASNQLGEFESGATAALLGPVASVVVGGVGTLLVAAAWWKLFPSLARRDRMQPPPG